MRCSRLLRKWGRSDSHLIDHRTLLLLGTSGEIVGSRRGGWEGRKIGWDVQKDLWSM
jgi:hypothetical protein